jgi:hypothetical protein
MRTQLFGVMTGVALLASTGLASAGQRVTLTDAQLDGIVAGDASVTATALNAITLGGATATLSDNPAGAGHVATATIFASFAPTGPTGTMNFVSVGASAN